MVRRKGPQASDVSTTDGRVPVEARCREQPARRRTLGHAPGLGHAAWTRRDRGTSEAARREVSAAEILQHLIGATGGDWRLNYSERFLDGNRGPKPAL